MTMMKPSSHSHSHSHSHSSSILFILYLVFVVVQLVTVVIASPSSLPSTHIGGQDENNVDVGATTFIRSLKEINTSTTAPKPKPKPKSSRPIHSQPPPQGQDLLSFTHYQKSCPDLEGIVQRKVAAWVKKDHTFAASLIRLHFHDCAVRGCDGSILLNHKQSERKAKASKTLRGFEVIDDIKKEVERKCPKTVSCADILTAAARDATINVGGPFWAIPFGRKDGRISVAKEADNVVPVGRESVTQLLKFCEARGLNVLDLVVLSGAHTIGRSTCEPLQERLNNFNKTSKPDPSLDPKYLNDLRKKCKSKRATEFVNLDVTTPTKFDTVYYSNLQKKKGLLITDQMLNSDPRTSPFVSAFASQPTIFDPQFAASMVKLGNIHVLTGKNQGEIRLNCNFVNPPRRK